MLTEAGAAFRPVILALYAWSERHVTGHARKLVADRPRDRRGDRADLVDRRTGRPVEELDVAFAAGENAGEGMRARYAAAR